MPMQKEWVSVLPYVHSLRDLNYYGLKITGLKPGDYTVTVELTANDIHLELTGSLATVGLTAGYDNAATSLIEGASGSQTAAWSLGLARKDVWRDGDALGLTQLPDSTDTPLTGDMPTLLLQGRNEVGQVSDGTTVTRRLPTLVLGSSTWIHVSIGRLHACGLRSDRRLLCWVSSWVCKMHWCTAPAIARSSSPRQRAPKA